MQRHYLTLAILSALSVAPASQAQSQDEQHIETMVVVSSRVEVPVRELTTSVSVVTKQAIEDRGYATLADVLRIQPAINVTSSGGLGSTTALRIRGEEGYRTLVRVDGVDISDPTGTQVQPQIAHLQSANIGKVEILRGTQGLVYGADAGGVINVQSNTYDSRLQGSVSAETGRYDTFRLTADVGGASDNLDYYVSAARFSTDGFNSRVDDTEIADEDGYANSTVHTRLGVKLNDKLRLGLVGRHNQGEGEFDRCGFGSSLSQDCVSEFAQQNLRASLDYAADTGNHQLAYAKTFVERENFNQGIASFFTKGNLERVEYLGQSALNPDHRLIYGFDWEKESITSADQSRTQRGYYLEYQGQPVGNFYLTAGLRHDNNEDFGEHTSYRVSGAYLWDLSNGELKLRSAYGTGFRAPSLFEIEYNRGPFAFAPASETALSEEQTRGYEVAFEYNDKSGSRYQLVYFKQQIQDSIFFDLTNFSGYLQDKGTANSKGVEVIADLALTQHFGVNANYTYNEAKDSADQPRLRRPRHLANLGVYYQGAKLRLSANARLVRDFIDGETKLDDYEVIDVSARLQIEPQLAVFARIENLFDSDYQDVEAFNVSGIAAHAGVKYQF